MRVPGSNPGETTLYLWSFLIEQEKINKIKQEERKKKKNKRKRQKRKGKVERKKGKGKEK